MWLLNKNYSVSVYLLTHIPYSDSRMQRKWLKNCESSISIIEISLEWADWRISYANVLYFYIFSFSAKLLSFLLDHMTISIINIYKRYNVFVVVAVEWNIMHSSKITEKLLLTSFEYHFGMHFVRSQLRQADVRNNWEEQLKQR